MKIVNPHRRIRVRHHRDVSKPNDGLVSLMPLVVHEPAKEYDLVSWVDHSRTSSFNMTATGRALNENSNGRSS